MTLLEEIQNQAVDSKSDLAEILRKCKVLAARLDSKPLENWVLWESNGYPIDVELPDYRKWAVILKGHFTGPFSRLNYAPISNNCVPSEVRDLVCKHRCRQSIASVQDSMNKSEGGIFRIPYNELAHILGDRVYLDMNCLQVWGEFGEAQLSELLNTVRNRILDFTLALSKEFPTLGKEVDSINKIPPQAITNIFNTTVNGGAANVVGQSTNSTFNINVVANDFESLKKALKENGIEDKYINELSTAIKDEPRPSDINHLGPKVAKWVGKMTNMAASGLWNIGMNAAGGFLATALAKFYGLIP